MIRDTNKTTIVWFFRDLRLADNPAVHAAAERGSVLPVYIHAPDDEGKWRSGAASNYWLHQSLLQFQKELAKRHCRLVLRKGRAEEVLDDLLSEAGADAVYWNRRYEPALARRDHRVARDLGKRGVDVKTFNGNLLHEPEGVQTQQGAHYKVFTPFWRACRQYEPPPEPLPAPSPLSSPSTWPRSLELDDLALEPEIDWTGGIQEAWTFGEPAAHEQLEAFLDESLVQYKRDRDRPDRAGTSRLSPHLAFGELSARQISYHTRQMMDRSRQRGVVANGEAFLREIYWREFAYHLLVHEPQTTDEPLQSKFKAFPWRRSKAELKAWQKGRTGYPYIDAGMRELWTTGWMHNRVRMAVASFLVKDLVLPWQRGAEWFWDTLVDADLANNTLNWQWTAGCGADAAPYFRVFNPVTQGKRFDPEGDYVRRWVPEIAKLPNRYIHTPWNAPKKSLDDAGIALGETYPEPMVNHAEARDRALAAFESIK